MTVFKTTLVLCIIVSVIHGFATPNALQQQEAGNAQFRSDLANSASGTCLDLKLDVGSSNHFHMCLQGLALELSGETAVANLLPDNAVTGAGAKSILIHDEAHFVGMTGRESVPLKDGCWELVWRDNAGAGVIIFGFLLEERVQRNEASLEMGRIFMTFPVWTTRGLKHQQEYRRMIEAQAEIHSQEKLDASKKMDETRNVIQKALLFRRVVEANEKLSHVNTDSVAMIPQSGDVMALGQDIQIITKGTVWTREEMPPSLLGGHSIRHCLLGTASIRPGSSFVAP